MRRLGFGYVFLLLNIYLLTSTLTTSQHQPPQHQPPEKKPKRRVYTHHLGFRYVFLINIFIYTLTYYITAPPPRRVTTSPPLPVSSPCFYVCNLYYVYILCFLLCLYVIFYMCLYCLYIMF